MNYNILNDVQQIDIEEKFKESIKDDLIIFRKRIKSLSKN